MIKNLNENNTIHNINFITIYDDKSDIKIIKDYDVKSPIELIRENHDKILFSIDEKKLIESGNKKIGSKNKSYSDKQLTSWLIKLNQITIGSKQNHVDILLKLKRKHRELYKY